MSEVYRYDLSLPTNAKNFGMRLSENGCWVEHESYAALESERDALRARVQELEKTLNWHEKHSCSVCLGEPLRSGKRCVCRGVGTASGEAQGFREEMHALRASIVALAAGWAAMAKNHEHLMRITDSSVIMAEHRTAAHMFREHAAELRQLGEGNGRD